ncbi:TPA: hypothetical protein ACWP2R_004754, partial [Escherichia coli]
HAFSSGAGRTSDGNGSHASTLKSPSYTKSVSWQHYPGPVVEVIGVNTWFFWSGVALIVNAVLCRILTRRYDKVTMKPQVD